MQVTGHRQQFNVTVEAALIRRVKHRAIDAQLSLADFVTQALEHWLGVTEEPMSDDISPSGRPPRLQPMVHVEDMASAVTFYEALGGVVRQGSRDGDWVLMSMGGGEISLLAHPPNPEQHEGTVELNFQAAGPLDELERALRQAGVAIVRPVNDEGYGRQLQVASPDGLLIKINELDPELYT